MGSMQCPVFVPVRCGVCGGVDMRLVKNGVIKNAIPGGAAARPRPARPLPRRMRRRMACIPPWACPRASLPAD